MEATEIQATGLEMAAPWWRGRKRSGDREAAGTGALPVVQLQARPPGFGVRALNFLIASAAFLLLAPLILLIGIGVKLGSRGPVIYSQDRVGLDRRNGGTRAPQFNRRDRDLGGRPFRMYKFRTMRVGAEHGTGPVWAKPRDSRVTLLGRLLRKTRIDELPQLWNVIRGDMNIVGPRPERPTLATYLAQEIECYNLRHSVRPGITGWAQINQAYDTTLQSVRCKLMYDLDYIQRRSVFFDLQIMLKTVPAVLRKRGGW